MKTEHKGLTVLSHEVTDTWGVQILESNAYFGQVHLKIEQDYKASEFVISHKSYN